MGSLIGRLSKRQPGPLRSIWGSIAGRDHQSPDLVRHWEATGRKWTEMPGLDAETNNSLHILFGPSFRSK
jgi:hypothetical protein